MVAVDPEFESRGIGNLLVQAAENFLIKAAREASEAMQILPKSTSNLTLRITIPVMNYRNAKKIHPELKDLFRFYSKRGYTSLRNKDEDPQKYPGFARMFRDEWAGKICFHFFFKDIALAKGA
eukprot:gnl/MRDRNA2_/MRDRNA2_79880_c0_seq1.p1 gnl/MRDRNA2_/MRDRNA2_79880_c0~~gnl/MRDRNA2_/MRDRNA2_79880_c0_seq1.p1  ORF type:complete len:123 (+),score=15.93 gnl/MRDRNA2_/MRDRNA2_79880_c0_seq1:155-523(+)